MKWIKTSERLPEIGKLVVCRFFIENIFDNDNNFDMLKIGRLYLTKDGFLYADGNIGAFSIDCVTHWCEIPELPEEE